MERPAIHYSPWASAVVEHRKMMTLCRRKMYGRCLITKNWSIVTCVECLRGLSQTV